jgi:hypothetical protein
MVRISAKYWSEIPVIASMANGYTDATFLGAVGIPTYGIPGIWYDPDGNGAHGLNERKCAQSMLAVTIYTISSKPTQTNLIVVTTKRLPLISGISRTYHG